MAPAIKKILKELAANALAQQRVLAELEMAIWKAEFEANAPPALRDDRKRLPAPKED